MAHKIVQQEPFDLTITEVRVLLDWYEFLQYHGIEGDVTEDDISLRTRLKTLEGKMVRRIRAKMTAVDLGTLPPTRMRMRNIRKEIKDGSR